MSRLIAIASGKGGVGKTLITASLSVLLQRRGYRVLAADADMGLRNLDLLFGMGDAVRYDASQAARGKCLPRHRCTAGQSETDLGKGRCTVLSLRLGILSR